MLTHHFNWKRLSMSAAVGFAPDGSHAWLVFNMRPGSYNHDSIIELLENLHTHLGDDELTLICDGLPSHRSRVMKAWVVKQRHWLVVEPLRLRTRPQSRRTRLGKPQVRRARQSVPGRVGES